MTLLHRARVRILFLQYQITRKVYREMGNCFTYYITKFLQAWRWKKQEKRLQICKKPIATQIIRHAAEYMKSHVSVEDLRYAVLFPLPSIKKEPKRLFTKAKTEVKEAESIDDIFFVVGDHNNFLSYSLVSHLINLYGNNELKKEMDDYSKEMAVFRLETRLVIFCEECDDKPEKDDSKFSTVVTKHQMDWATRRRRKFSQRCLP